CPSQEAALIGSHDVGGSSQGDGAAGIELRSTRRQATFGAVDSGRVAGHRAVVIGVEVCVDLKDDLGEVGSAGSGLINRDAERIGSGGGDVGPFAEGERGLGGGGGHGGRAAVVEVCSAGWAAAGWDCDSIWFAGTPPAGAEPAPVRAHFGGNRDQNLGEVG